MKKTFLVIALASIGFVSCKNGEKKETSSKTSMETVDSTSTLTNADNSETSLDWAGIYQATTPCADCEGIKTVLELKNDNTYTLSMTYLGKPEGTNKFEQQGTFEWDETGSNVTLKTEGQPIELKVGENQVWMLDGDGNVITGDIGAMFILKKKVD